MGAQKLEDLTVTDATGWLCPLAGGWSSVSDKEYPWINVGKSFNSPNREKQLFSRKLFFQLKMLSPDFFYWKDGPTFSPRMSVPADRPASRKPPGKPPPPPPSQNPSGEPGLSFAGDEHLHLQTLVLTKNSALPIWAALFLAVTLVAFPQRKW